MSDLENYEKQFAISLIENMLPEMAAKALEKKEFHINGEYVDVLTGLC